MAAPSFPGGSARHPKLAEFISNRAILRGSFKLVSGRTSSYYCDGKQVTFSGEGLALIADALEREVTGIQFDAIGGMDMGATPIVAALSLALHQRGRTVPSFVVRKEAKAHGTRKAIEGVLPKTPGRVLMIDDVVTSGDSILKAIAAVREAGHEVVLAVSILDRDGGGAAAIEKVGVPYRPLVTIAELGISND